jgi:hypothetical protein
MAARFSRSARSPSVVVMEGGGGYVDALCICESGYAAKQRTSFNWENK